MFRTDPHHAAGERSQEDDRCAWENRYFRQSGDQQARGQVLDGAGCYDH